jgi:hypothetical protein
VKLAIYDMDGTIVDSSHRYRTITDADGITRIDLAHWRENEFRAMDDGLLPLAAQYMADQADSSVYTIIATARVMRDPDYRFVREILGQPNYLISRNPDENISGAALKIRGLVKFFNLTQFNTRDAVFYEDNIHYLKAVCDRFQIRGVYIPSVQGH